VRLRTSGDLLCIILVIGSGLCREPESAAVVGHRRSCSGDHFVMALLPIDSPWSSRSNAPSRLAWEAPEHHSRCQLARRR
jgi:hypothetical protein